MKKSIIMVLALGAMSILVAKQNIHSFVLQTGQTKSYSKTNYFKAVDNSSPDAIHDDGWYATVKKIAPRKSYTRNNKTQIITDNVTKLQWQDNIGAAKVRKNWQNAKRYCQNLTLGGHKNWRLPTIQELLSITDLSVFKPAVNTKIFKNIVSDYYWSSTPCAVNTSDYWDVDFYGGHSSHDIKYISNNIRCVRSEK